MRDELYRPAEVEAAWQARWDEAKTFEVSSTSDKPKYYILEMFPYPSGNLHMGHVRNYSIGDVVARFKRARGFDVLHPMGWDSFGMPAENAAIQRGTHPAKWTKQNIAVMRAQLRSLGLSYDWSREVTTCEPKYYRWEQEIFLDLLAKGLAYKKGGLLNWCDSCETTLANEQVEDGVCWRCETTVVQRELQQWYLRITDYAEQLLDDLKTLDGWPSAVKSQQETWIGKSVGASIQFEIDGAEGIEGVDGPLEVFTTRPDTLYGCTYMSLAPEHPWTRRLAAGTEQEAAVVEFADRMATTEKADRMDDKAEKEGVFTGRHAINPVNGRRIRIYTANFVLADYGTGAVMAVPAHDQRDFEFATKYGIDKVVVIQPEGESLDPATMEAAWTGVGTMVNSGPHDGTHSTAGKAAVIGELESTGRGAATINYRLRDWGISRQRYWGTPIPVVYCEACGMRPVPRDQLPVVLPLDVELTGEAGSPLARSPEFVNTSCPDCGGPAERETDTFDTFMESSWYFLRYCSPEYLGGMVDPAAAKRFLAVDQYIGGSEHAVMHLLYARFYTKALRDLGVVDIDEPFTNLLTQGMVCHETYRVGGEWVYPSEVEDGVHKPSGERVEVGRVEKMSKSKRNTVDPLDMIARYGADTARLFVLFAAPPAKDVAWSMAGVEGSFRFLSRVWRLTVRQADRSTDISPYEGSGEDLSSVARDFCRVVHRTIERVTTDVEKRLHLNTAIAAIMELVNDAYRFEASEADAIAQEGVEAAVLALALDTIVRLLSPFAPHIAHELWQRMGGTELLEDVPWPEHDPAMLAVETITLAVQVKGKRRGEVTVPVDADAAAIEAAARALPNVAKFVGDAPPRRVIVVPGRLINIIPG
jgi:leucyl-tRNA synthetase